jgi:hypothetical protein
MRQAVEITMDPQASVTPRPGRLKFGFDRIVAATDFSPTISVKSC